MEPGQYTGKTSATQGDSAGAGRRAPQGRGGADGAGGAAGGDGGDRGGLPRALMWGAIAVALVAGLVLYFGYERAVVPVVGGGH